MSKQAFDRKLAAIAELRDASEEAAIGELQKALRDRNNYAVAKAAAIVGDRQFHALIPDLAGAFERFLRDASKSDPQCWAKNAIAKALKELEHLNADIFFRGAQHYQYEPTWGGQVDTAVTLRGTCALALVGTTAPSFDILLRLTDLLADPEKDVRIDAARAMGQLTAREGLLPLRLKVRAGDKESEVLGHCFAALLSIAPGESLGFVTQFLESPDDNVQLEAAGALAESREVEALSCLKEFYSRKTDPEVKSNVLRFLAASPLEGAAEFLLKVVEDGSTKTAAEALRAFMSSRHRAGLFDRAEAVVKGRGDGELRRILGGG